MAPTIEEQSWRNAKTLRDTFEKSHKSLKLNLGRQPKLGTTRTTTHQI